VPQSLFVRVQQNQLDAPRWLKIWKCRLYPFIIQVDRSDAVNHAESAAQMTKNGSGNKQTICNFSPDTNVYVCATFEPSEVSTVYCPNWLGVMILIERRRSVSVDSWVTMKPRKTVVLPSITWAVLLTKNVNRLNLDAGTSEGIQAQRSMPSKRKKHGIKLWYLLKKKFFVFSFGVLSF
jgi:hypothetical protein